MSFLSSWKLPVLTLFVCLLPVVSWSEQSTKPLQKILFGSCLRQDKPMPILEVIVKQEPDLFLFLGDNIYADTEDMDLMRAKYAQLNGDPGFSALRAQCPLMATWDDHDFGLNDAGREYSRKVESQQTFLNFWGEPFGSPRRKRAGIYDAAVSGPVGKRVQIIVLDTRFHRGPLKKGERRVGGPYYPQPDPTVPMLGDAQWVWLEEQLRVPAELRIIASSIQFIAEAAGQETWSNLPAERQRMVDLVTRTKAQGVIFVSGDRHWSELSVLKQGAPYPLYDLTSSSLNTVHGRGTPTGNRHRALGETYHRQNFGLIEIDWESPAPKITLQIRDLENTPKLGKTIALEELAPKGSR